MKIMKVNLKHMQKAREIPQPVESAKEMEPLGEHCRNCLCAGCGARNVCTIESGKGNRDKYCQNTCKGNGGATCDCNRYRKTAPEPDNADVFLWLTTAPASDINFRAALERATEEEINEALQFMKKRKSGHKIRIMACERELRKRRKRKYV